MPALTNPKWEIFAQELSKGKSQAEAYQDAGYKPSEPNASRLTSNDKVRTRICELQERAAKKTETTIEDLVREMDENRKLAFDTKQSGAAVAATTSKAKLLGLWVERQETGKPGEFDDLTVEQKRERVLGRVRQLGIDRIGPVSGTA